MKISFLVAVSQNNVIGLQGKLPWYLPADMEYFRDLTLDHSVIMGRKTYDSIGKALENRKNIILTRQRDLIIADALIANTFDEILDLTKNEEEIFIVGGTEIFKLIFPYANRIYLTRIHEDFVGDTFWPDFDLSNWKKIKEEFHSKDSNNQYDYSFIVYEKIKEFEQ